MNLKESFVYFGAGVGGVFFGYWLLIATDQRILRHLEKGDMATWFAASGTILTLAFLIKQHTQLRQEQKKEKDERRLEAKKQKLELNIERLKRQNHENKQKEMWREQREMLTFQKLQMHKSLFNNLLNEIESDCNVTFFNRSKLYEKVFPKNSFDNFDIKISNKNELNISPNILTDIREAYRTLINQLSNFSDKNDGEAVLNHLDTLSSISNKLHFTPKSFNNFGDLSKVYLSEEVFITNIFSLQDTISKYENILERICGFAGLDFLSSHTNWESSYYRNALQQIFLGSPSMDQYKVNLGDIRSSVSSIFFANKFIKNNESLNPDFNSTIYFINITLLQKLRNKNELEAIVELEPCAQRLNLNINDTIRKLGLVNEDWEFHKLCLDDAVGQLNFRKALLEKNDLG